MQFGIPVFTQAYIFHENSFKCNSSLGTLITFHKNTIKIRVISLRQNILFRENIFLIVQIPFSVTGLLGALLFINAAGCLY